MTIFERLLPREASNDYTGSRSALYALAIFLVPIVIRSLIHFLKQDSGVNSIATIHVFPGDPDPNRVIYMFSSLWGTQQLITAAIALIVLCRYRSLVPLVWGFLVIEICLRLSVGLIHPLTPEYYASRPPGSIGNLPGLLFSLTFFALSLRPARTAGESLPQPAS